MCDTTRPVGAVLSWESYCAEVGVDPHAARRATLTAALWALVGGSREMCDTLRTDAQRCDSEPSAPTPDDTADNGQPF